MDRAYTQFVNAVSAQRIVLELQNVQHLWPHEPIRAALQRAGDASGFCPDAAARATQLLQLDASRQIGRLKRCELLQLGRTIHRLWLGCAVNAPVASA